jgi:hypothetical protein
MFSLAVQKRWEKLEIIDLPMVKISDSPNHVLRIPQWEQLHTLSVRLYFNHHEHALFPAVRFFMASIKQLRSLYVLAKYQADSRDLSAASSPIPAVLSATIPLLDELTLDLRFLALGAPDVVAADSLFCGLSLPRLTLLKVEHGGLQFSARALFAQCPALLSLELWGSSCVFDFTAFDRTPCNLKALAGDFDLTDKEALDILHFVPGLVELRVMCDSMSRALLIDLSLVGHKHLEYLMHSGIGLTTELLHS